jgi:phage major head subunit gpT-like protein
MAGTILTERGMKATFLASLQGWPSMFRQLCTIVNSDGYQEKYPWLGAPPAVREFVGPRKAARIAETSYTIFNKKWEATLRIDQDDLDDDQLGGLQTRVQQMAEYAARHMDKIVMGTTIPNGTAALCYDGQYFYDDDHSDPEAVYTTSQDNDLTANITTTSNPTTVEFATALQAALKALRGFKDGNGDPVNPPGAKVWLEGNPTFERIFMKFALANLLGTDAATNAEDNTFKGLIGGYILNPWDSNTDRVRFHILDGTLKPFVFQMRKDWMTQLILADEQKPDFSAFSEDANWFGAKARYNAGYGDWRKSVSYIFT